MSSKAQLPLDSNGQSALATATVATFASTTALDATGCASAEHGIEQECVLEDFDDELLDEGLQALAEDQCWGAALGYRAGGNCTPGFVRGQGHLKNKFCEACRLSGVFVRCM